MHKHRADVLALSGSVLSAIPQIWGIAARIGLGAFAVLCLTGQVWALDFQSHLKPVTGARTPTDTIEVHIPANVPDDQLRRLHLAIDGTDIREQIEVRGDYAAWTPGTPLAPGQHRLDLVERMEDGTVITRGSWEIIISGDPGSGDGTVEYSGGLSVTADGVAKLAAKNPATHDFAGNGSIDSLLRGKGKWWEVGAHAPFVWDTANQTLAGRNFDVADYLFDARMGPLYGYAGHHSIEYDNLLMSGFNRRGVSGKLQFEKIKTSVSAFEMQSSVTSGFDNFFGLNDRNDRVRGVAGATTPIDQDNFGMDVSFAYVDSVDPEIGPSTSSTQPAKESTGWGVTSTFRFLENTLSLRGDFADSEFLVPGGGTPAQDGDAYKLTLAYAPNWTFSMFGGDTKFQLGADYQRFSTFFNNPANSADIRDLERYSITTNLAGNEWAWGLSYAQAYDNVDDSPLLPRVRGRGGASQMSYAPAAKQDAEGNTQYGVLGNGQYSLSFAYTDTLTVDPPRTGDPGLPTDTVNGELRATADFDKGTWQWGVSYGAIVADDRTADELSFTHSAAARTAFTWQKIGLAVTPTFQYDRTNFDGARADETAIVGDFTALYSPPETPISAGLSVNASHNRATDSSVDTTTYLYSFNLGWVVVDGTASGWPKLELAFQGAYQKTDDNSPLGASMEDYTAFLKASMGWSRTFSIRR